MADCSNDEAATDEYLKDGFVASVKHLAQPENDEALVEILAVLGIENIRPATARLARCQARRSLLVS